MAIGLICKNCGAKLKVTESAAGKVGKCPKCQQPIRVPKTDAPEAHFCDQCGKSLAGQQEMHLVDGKMLCGECYDKTHAPESSGDPILEQIGLNIPGLVVLRGKEQRQMGRVLQDVHAKKDFKTKAKDQEQPEAPAAEEEQPAPEETVPSESAEAPEPATPPEAPVETPVEVPAEEPVEEEPAEPEPPAEETSEEVEEEEVAEGFDVPVEEPQAEAPVSEELEIPEEPETPEPEPETEPAPAPAEKFHKGQRASDELLIRLLIDQGIVLEGELELALQYQKGIGKRLIPVLDDLKLTSEEDITKAIAGNTGLECCPPGELEIAPHVESMLDDEMIRLYEAVPLTREGDALVAAFPNPLDINSMKALREALEIKIIPRICTWTQFKEARAALKKAAAG